LQLSVVLSFVLTALKAFGSGSPALLFSFLKLIQGIWGWFRPFPPPGDFEVCKREIHYLFYYILSIKFPVGFWFALFFGGSF